MYFALGAMRGNTFVSDAAAITVGVEPPEAAVVVLDAVVVAAGAAVLLELLLELLLPQPAAHSEIPMAATAASLSERVPNNENSPSEENG